MKCKYLRKILILFILAGFIPRVSAEDKRVLPLDVYLIIDGSESLKNTKSDVAAWINEQVVDRILAEGDKIAIWSAGEKAAIVYSGTISGAAEKNGIKDNLKALDSTGKKADFSGAMSDVSAKVSQTPQGRLSYTMLITASAGGLEPALSGNSQGLFRWFRSERYGGWQVLVAGPDIGRKVQQSAAAYINSF